MKRLPVEQLFVYLFFFFCSFLTSEAQNRCSVCRDSSAVTLPQKKLALPDPYAVAVQTCGDLDALAPLLLTLDSAECQTIQSVSTYCGCPVPENACQFCEGGDSNLVDPQTVVDFPLIPSDVLVPNCGILEAYLHSLPQNSPNCTLWQEQYQDICPCAPSPTQSPALAGQTQGPRGNGSSPQPTLAPLQPPNKKCGICADGAQMTLPDKDVAYLVGGFLTDEYASFFNGESSKISCQMLEAILQITTAPNDVTCTDAQFLLGGPCGCPTPLSNPCHFCPDGLPEPEQLVYTTTLAGFPPSKCQDIQLFYQYSIDASNGFCKEGQDTLGYFCFCTDEILYLGAKNKSQKAWLAWLPRLTSLLSISGSSFILYEIGSKMLKRRNALTIFDELIGSISILDLIYSLGTALSTLPVPEYTTFGEPTGIYGAQGSEWSCTLQGVILQFGLTGVFYQLSLSYYYVLVIRLGWQESRVRKEAGRWFHLPLLAGVGLAAASTP